MTGFDAENRFRAAVAAHRAGDLAAAEAGYREVLAHAPRTAPALHNLGMILARQAREADLVPVLSALVELEPSADLHWRLATALLSLGRYAEAWPHFEQRPRKIPPVTSVPEWRDEPLDGKSLLVWHDEGLGDQIMMARLLPSLPAERLTWAVMPPLLRLFRQLCPTLSRIGAVSGRFDYWAPAMSLPARVGLTLETLPDAPYLVAEAEQPRRGCIGVMTAAGLQVAQNRTLPREQAARLLALPGAVDLDPARTGAQDLQDTARIIAGLDLVITVDTAAAHLAGALGKPVWVLLPTPSDWRWLRDPDRTPWYPTARLWRQPTPGDWSAVVDRVLEAVGRPSNRLT